jgi:amino acid transporter
MQGIDWFAVTGVLLILVLAYWYADRKRHPRRSAVSAALIFVLVFGGIALAGFVAVAGIVYAFGLDEAGEATVVTVIVPILFFTVIAPAFIYARHRIQRPPGRRPRPPDRRDGRKGP